MKIDKLLISISLAIFVPSLSYISLYIYIYIYVFIHIYIYIYNPIKTDFKDKTDTDPSEISES